MLVCTVYQANYLHIGPTCNVAYVRKSFTDSNFFMLLHFWATKIEFDMFILRHEWVHIE